MSSLSDKRTMLEKVISTRQTLNRVIYQDNEWTPTSMQRQALCCVTQMILPILFNLEDPVVIESFEDEKKEFSIIQETNDILMIGAPQFSGKTVLLDRLCAGLLATTTPGLEIQVFLRSKRYISMFVEKLRDILILSNVDTIRLNESEINTLYVKITFHAFSYYKHEQLINKQAKIIIIDDIDEAPVEFVLKLQSMKSPESIVVCVQYNSFFILSSGHE
jgi:hypothetical protein